MAFTDHKISAFTHKISDLADQPNLPPDELKARFDACPEELRVAHNALCDEASRLDTRVSGIVTQTFGDSIPKSMLSDELAAEIDAAAVETSVAERLADEAAARESADTALDTRVDTLETAMPRKVEIYYGTYAGTGDTVRQTITLPITPTAVLLSPNGNAKARLVLPNQPATGDDGYYVGILNGNALTLQFACNIKSSQPHSYIAFV